MSIEGSANQNLYITNNNLDSRCEVKESNREMVAETNNNLATAGINRMFTNGSSTSAISLQSLDDDDFRNLLNSAAKPQYGSLQRKRKKSQKASEYGGRRLSDAGENTELSAEADNLLAQFRLEAELNQRNADIESGEQQRTVTAFIKEAVATSCARELLEKYTESETWESHPPEKHTRCGNNSTSNCNTKGFLRNSPISDGLSKTGTEQKPNSTANDDTMNSNNNSFISEDISRATQTANKSSGIVISFNDLNSISSIENGCVNTNKIAYIDEDEHVSDPRRPPNTDVEHNYSGRLNGGGFKNVYLQGNTVQEIRALNDSDDDEVMVNVMSKVSKKCEVSSAVEANVMDDKVKKSAEASIIAGTQGKHDDNPFTYSAGQLRLHGNRVGTYDMQKSRALGVKRDMLSAEGEYDYTYSGCVSPAFLSLIPANTSNSLLARDLIPAHFDGRETYARGLLDPTEDTRLNPQQGNLDNEMANLKNQPDKCAIAKRRKENKKAKEAKNSYVVESKDGYMGNLSPEEILKRIEGDSKGKAKGNQKNGTNVPKDHSSVAANGSRNSGGRKRGDKKERQTEKIAKRPVIVDREVVELSTKLETLNIKKVETVVMTDTNSEPNHPSLLTGTKTSKKEAVTTSSQDGKVEEAGSGAKITTKAAIDEGVDDEEQYLSADEGANSNVSDDIKTELQYHTDEQSGASGSRDFISDGANYRADDEEINPLPVTSEESEFIQVTTRSKRRGGGASSMQHQQQALSPGVERKNVYFNSMIDRGGRGNIRRDADRLRRSSVQLPPDDSRRNQQPSSRGNTSPSPVDSESFKKYSAPPRFRMLISEIIDNTLMKAQENKASAGKAQTVINSGIAQSRQQRQQQHLKPATSTSMGKKAKYGLPSSLQTSRTASPDRRSSQPLTLKYSVAAGSAQNDSSVVSLSEGLSDAKQKVTDQQINTVTVASANPPAQHSWADIAKRRLYSSAEVRPSEGSHAYVHGYSSDLHGSVKEERSVSTSSVSGHLENTKKIEQTLGVEALSGDLAVKDYSFFFDPNEPAGTISKEIEPGSSKIVSKDTEEDSKFSKPRCAGIVLNLDGGRQLVLPESDVITTTPATVIDIRQRPEVLIVNEMWRDFTEDPAEVVTYREYQRQREQLKNQGSSQKNRKEKVEK